MRSPRNGKCRSSELTTDKSTIIHKKSGRKISYGEVVAFASVPAEPPKITEGDLKKPSQFKLIGRKDIGRSRRAVEGQRLGEIRHRCAGAGHGLCLGASVADGRREGRKRQCSDDVMKIKGVTHVMPLPFGVAVVGDTVEATRSGLQALKVTWDTSGAKAAGFDSDKAKDDYASKAKDPNAEAKDEYQGRRREGGSAARPRRSRRLTGPNTPTTRRWSR